MCGNRLSPVGSRTPTVSSSRPAGANGWTTLATWIRLGWRCCKGLRISAVRWLACFGVYGEDTRNSYVRCRWYVNSRYFNKL